MIVFITLHKGIVSFAFLFVGVFSVALAVPLVINEVLKLFQTTRSSIQEAYWQIIGVSIISSGIAFIIAGAGLVVLSFSVE